MEIYKIINTINNKVYVGQTVGTSYQRFRNHKNYCNTKYSKGIKLYNAFKKHGIDNFSFQIIASCDTVDELNDLEIYYIKQYDSVSNGYNSTYGGKNSLPSKEVIEKMRAALTGLKRSKETKEKLSLCKKGKKYFLGGKHSEKTKKLFSEQRKGKIITNAMKNKASITMIEKHSGINNPFYGKKHTEETIEKLKLAAIRPRIKKINEITTQIIKNLTMSGMPTSCIAKETDMSRYTVRRVQKKYGWAKEEVK